MQDFSVPAPLPGEVLVPLPSPRDFASDGQARLPAPATDGHERDIVQRARTGDQQALADLYDLYFPRIYRYILARTGSPPEAEDVTEEVFVRMLGGIGNFEWREAPFAAWLFRIAHNQVVSNARKNGVRQQETQLSVSIADQSPDPFCRVEDRLHFEQIFAVARCLPQAQREVLWLRFAVGLSVGDTARALGKHEGNVKVLQHKAIAKLQKLLVGTNGTTDVPDGRLPPSSADGRSGT
jgi:RNA polymerase sigma-70 factor (ECF subfamily)